jgi:hypothetical protein
VLCYFYKVANDRRVICSRVGALIANTTYFIGFKCAFLSTATAQQDNFARVTINQIIRNSTDFILLTYVLAGPTDVN